VAARDTAEGLAAIHAAGAVHGNINPASVIIHSDGGVTLTDLQLEESGAAVAPSADVRSVGAVLYAALTGRWPAEIPTPRATLPDALRADGKLCSPRQIRAGIPSYLDALTMDLLDPSIPTPPAAELAAELRRFDLSSPDAGVLDALPVDPPTRRSPWRRAVLPLAGLLVIALLGWIFGTRGLPVGNGPGYPETKAPAKNSGSSSPGNGPLPVAAVRILDPGGDGTELANAGRAADSRRATSWKTQVYTRPRFGNLKSGMGVLLDLGAVHEVRQVTIYLDQPGGALELRTGTGGADPAAYRLVASRNNARSALSFEVPAGVSSRYWLVWITELPLASGGGGYGLAVQEIVLVS
jgi:hypothetical protein